MFFHIIFLLYFLTTFLSSQVDRSNALININDLAFWVSSNGMMGQSPSGWAGGFYTNDPFDVGVVFGDGIIWGGYVVNNESRNIRVGGQTHFAATQAGWIENGVASNPENSRIYKIRKDWASLTHNKVKREAAHYYETDFLSVTEDMTTSIINQYRTDWYEWPAERGAPFYDLNDDGHYDPQTDIPGLLDADQVIWFVVNDLNDTLVANLYGSKPIGIEAQYTLWGYKSGGRLGQFFYKRVKLINKSTSELEDFYIAQWSDPDIGNFSNDLVGCDSSTSLMFAYSYQRNFPPHNVDPTISIGYKLLQGPLVAAVDGLDINNNGVNDSEDIATFNLEATDQGFINLPMTSFAYFDTHYSDWPDPTLGEFEGTLQWYNVLRGYIPNTDIENPNPFTHRRDSAGNGPETKFPLNGDPLFPWAPDNEIDGTGWGFASSDRRFVSCSGPFNMAPNDTQEVVYAVIGGLGDDYLNAIPEVKRNAEIAELYYEEYVKDFQPVSQTAPYNPPFKFIFQRPYPNPFNPIVNFKYEIAEEGMVRINVYNILGQKVTVLFNELAEAGENMFSWQASSFAAGVYIIQIRYKSYTLNQKVLLLK